MKTLQPVTVSMREEEKQGHLSEQDHDISILPTERGREDPHSNNNTQPNKLREPGVGVGAGAGRPRGSSEPHVFIIVLSGARADVTSCLWPCEEPLEACGESRIAPYSLLGLDLKILDRIFNYSDILGAVQLCVCERSSDPVTRLSPPRPP
ncbi:hypothetical protein SRHO_G00081820 [Serrasalmus rhombeus]